MSASRNEGENKSPFQEGIGKEKLKTMSNGNYLRNFVVKEREKKERSSNQVEEGKLIILRKFNEIGKEERMNRKNHVFLKVTKKEGV